MLRKLALHPFRVATLCMFTSELVALRLRTDDITLEMWSRWLIDLQIFGKVLLSHTKVLIFKLLNTTLESPILVP